MSIIEIVQYARGGTAIRRASWVPGLRLFWSDSHGGWRYANEFEATLGQSRPLILQTQGMITPETIVADDWEVIDQ
jgi:hypothetical protein